MNEFSLSSVIMHHPARAAALPALFAACAPLVPVVVADPDPDGPPSPLRTAKSAWAAVPEGATHHLVLQDDIVLADRFAERLDLALADIRRRRGAIALHVSWNSLHNAYQVRRSAAVGAAFADLAAEWVPTQGLVLPAADARDLARFLDGFPDSFRHEDVLIAQFCQERGIGVAAVVPNLVEHLDSESLAGNETHGERHATLFAGAVPGAADPGTADPDTSDPWPVPDALPVAQGRDGRQAFAIEFYNSECRIRLIRHDVAEPLDHPFGWYWHDWCPLLGLSADTVLDALEVFVAKDAEELGIRPRDLGALPSRFIVEIWAAGYLLGADVRDAGGRVTAVPRRRGLLRASIASWLDFGLRKQDKALIDEAGRNVLIDIGAAAVDQGGRNG
jgi:hypothetical protein